MAVVIEGVAGEAALAAVAVEPAAAPGGVSDALVVAEEVALEDPVELVEVGAPSLVGAVALDDVVPDGRSGLVDEEPSAVGLALSEVAVVAGEAPAVGEPEALDGGVAGDQQRTRERGIRAPNLWKPSKTLTSFQKQPSIYIYIYIYI